jgi:hypothetical protein
MIFVVYKLLTLSDEKSGTQSFLEIPDRNSNVGSEHDFD